MNRWKTAALCALSFGLLAGGAGFAGQNPEPNQQPGRGQAEPGGSESGSFSHIQVLRRAEIGSPVTPYVLDVDVRSLPQSEQWKPGDPIREIPQRFFRPANSPYERSHDYGFDPLARLQRETSTERGVDGFGTPNRNLQGQGFTGVNPPDTVGDVGLNHYIQMINSGGGALVWILDKAEPTPNLLASFALDSLGSGACANGFGDPIVQYDRDVDRWLLTEFAGSGNNLCVYVSQTPDPLAGGWFFYQFSTPSFPDYPHYSIWPTDRNSGLGSYVVTANDGGPGAYALDRGQMLQGGAATFQRIGMPGLSGFGIQAPAPADPDGATPPPAGSPAIIMRHRDTEAHGGPGATGDLLEIWEFDVDWVSPSNTTLSQAPNIDVAEFDSSLCGLSTLFCFPQPGAGSTTVMPLREPIHNRLQYINFGDHQTLMGNFITDVDGTDHGGLRWFELRKPVGGAWGLHQEGTYAPDDDNRYIGASSMDQSGNIALAYNVVSENTFPSLRYTGRDFSAPLGVMNQPEAVIHPGASANASNRYGDYAAMSLDPADDCTFWFTGMDNQTSVWRTQIASFRFDLCGCLAVPAPIAPETAVLVDNRIDISWTDSELDTITGYEIQRSRTQGGPYESIATVADTSPGVAGGPAYIYEDGDVSGEITYYYVIVAGDGEACRSEELEVSDTATGICSLRPVFDGATAVDFAASSTCSIGVSWNPASPECGGPALYNVYRSTVAGFTPDSSNLLVGGISDTFALDINGLVEGESYNYIVRALDLGNLVEDLNLAEISAPSAGPGTGLNTVFLEPFDTQAAFDSWTVGIGPGPHRCGEWIRSTTNSERPSGGSGGYALSKSLDCTTLLPRTSTFVDSPFIDLNLSGILGVTLDADIFFDHFDGGDTATIEVWDGSAWQTIWTDPDSDFNGHVNLDVTAYADGNSSFQVRFNYQNANDDRWFSFDNVEVIADILNPCTTSSAPASVPDGIGATGPLRGDRLTLAGDSVQLTWDTSCGATDYNLIYGGLSGVASVQLADAVCNLGTSGGFTWNAVPAESLFFLIVGDDGAGTESSWGEGTFGERNSLNPSGLCGAVQKNIVNTCE